VNARAAIPLTALVERRADQDAETAIGLRVRGFRRPTRGVEAARGDLQVLTELGDGELGLLRKMSTGRIFGVRCATLNAITPYTPSAATAASPEASDAQLTRHANA
jgi:hypothetical protein